MLILQRWEPIISPLFLSQIPLWIKLQGLPLHFWHEQMIYNIGQDLDTLEDYSITKTSARIKVSVDGLKPLITDVIIDFTSGEDLPVTLEYEDLGYHCSLCNRLSHLARNCPSAQRLPPFREQSPPAALSRYKAPKPRDEAFRTRIDRHGNPFGDRLPLLESRARPLHNKTSKLLTAESIPLPAS